MPSSFETPNHIQLDQKYEGKCPYVNTPETKAVICTSHTRRHLVVVAAVAGQHVEERVDGVAGVEAPL